MADTDVIGIVSLLLAAGGAAYLFRARMKSQARARAAPVITEKPSAARDADTLPPLLRPETDRPTKKTKKAGSVPTQASAKTTTPESPAAKAAPADSARTHLSSNPDLLDLSPASVPPSTKPEELVVPTLPPPKELLPAKERLVVDSDYPKLTPAPVTIPEKKGSFKKQTIVGLPLPAVLDAVPKIDFEEDDDVEPTRVGRYDRQSIRPPIEKHVFDEGADGEINLRASRPLALAVYALAQTDPGKRRKENQDSFLIREDDSLYVVADGMGGHKGGQQASRLAVEIINDAFEKKNFEAEAHADLPPAASELARAIQMANATILNEAQANPELAGMGTTLCAAHFTDENRRLFIGHVGDSRCYRLRGGNMKQMTADHTMADYGVTGPEGAHLSRALGVWPTVPIDVIMARPELDDVYLICSDGLTKMLPNETISTQLMHEEDPKAAATRLVLFANAKGGKDNITIILLRVVEPGWTPPSEREPAASS